MPHRTVVRLRNPIVSRWVLLPLYFIMMFHYGFTDWSRPNYTVGDWRQNMAVFFSTEFPLNPYPNRELTTIFFPRCPLRTTFISGLGFQCDGFRGIQVSKTSALTDQRRLHDVLKHDGLRIRNAETARHSSLLRATLSEPSTSLSSSRTSV